MTALLRPRARRHALAGQGLIVTRARAALRRVAAQFGEITRADDTSVEVRTSDGLSLTLSYDPGDYVFSRVYNLTVTATLPADSAVPGDLVLSHRNGGSRYARKRASGSGDRALDALNAAVGERIERVDLLRSEVSGPKGGRTVTLTPLGGAYVWVLIPPVFKATAFPPGEPERMLDLIRALASWRADSVASAAA